MQSIVRKDEVLSGLNDWKGLANVTREKYVISLEYRDMTF